MKRLKDKIDLEIHEERMSQNRTWGVQDHNPFEWLAILGEEVGEVNKAAMEWYFAHEKPCKWRQEDLSHVYDKRRYREELIQVAAVAKAMIESLDRDEWKCWGLRNKK